MAGLYVQAEIVEALGRAVIARSELELAFDVLLAILALEPTRFGTCSRREPLETKADYLTSVSGSRLLKHDWWRATRAMGSQAVKLDQLYSSAAIGIIYTRGAGSLEHLLRQLADQTKVSRAATPLSTAKLAHLAQDFTDLAQRASELASSLLETARKLGLVQ